MTGFISHMKTALDQARLAAEAGEVPVGAVIVAPNGTIVARAGNRTRELNDPSAHAEMLAIRAACAVLCAERLTDHDLYVTLEPCAMCAGAIAHAVYSGHSFAQALDSEEQSNYLRDIPIALNPPSRAF